jgi:flagellin-like hook-associated protein FlgL
MVVQHNLRAMNSNRMLGITAGQLSKSSEKLSSGYKVNRAADDAAGLSISEKMRKQIRGLTQASLNAEDGISSVQTAEGALTEVHDMLQRMNELAVKASNGTNSISDRQTIQDEIDQLLTEVDRVSETTKFNETYLLKGNTLGTSSEKKVNAHDAGIEGKLVDKGGKTATFELEKALENGDEISIAGTKYTIGNNADTSSTEGYEKYASTDKGAETLKAGDTITYAPASDSPIEDYKTITMVEKVENANNFATNSAFEIEDESGHKTTYKVGTAAGTGADGVQIDTVAGIEVVIQQALDAGHKVTMTNNGAKAVNWEVVKELDDDEISATVWNSTNTDTVDKLLKADTSDGGLKKTDTDIKSVTLGGEKTTFTTQVKTISADDLATAVGMLKAGDQITIQDVVGSNQAAAATTITIADVTDAKNGQYTTEDALKLINIEDGDMDEVSFTLMTGGTPAAVVNKAAQNFLKKLGITAGDGTATADVVSVIGSPTQGEATDNVITAKEAYVKIAEELQKASSIGTDVDKAASVKDNGNGSFVITKGSTVIKDALSFNLHVGADADMTNKIGVTIDTMDTKGLGIQKLDVIGKDDNGEKIDDGGMAATYAIDSIADAIAKVSAQRSLLGAVQNRLEHTINNLDNVVENTTAAESQIRDTDMATEMVRYSNANILSQAGQSMLAQANQGNQGVLSLLG